MYMIVHGSMPYSQSVGVRCKLEYVKLISGSIHWLTRSQCDVWHFVSFTRQSTSEWILDVVSEQTKHAGIPFLCYEEILIYPFVLEYATLAINLSLLLPSLTSTQPPQTRHARPNTTDFMGYLAKSARSRHYYIVFDRDMIVSSSEIEDIIADMSCNKSPGLDGLTSEHMKFANSKLPVLLSILMSAVLIHGHVPRSAMRSVLVPIIKNKNKRITDKDNHRPICLSNVFTKVIEKVLLCRMQGWLSTTSNQFGFKHKHGTDMCVFTLKELIRYYIKHGSCRAYVCCVPWCFESIRPGKSEQTFNKINEYWGSKMDHKGYQPMVL